MAPPERRVRIDEIGSRLGHRVLIDGQDVSDLVTAVKIRLSPRGITEADITFIDVAAHLDQAPQQERP